MGQTRGSTRKALRQKQGQPRAKIVSLRSSMGHDRKIF
jgi:hypothetical protein